MRLRTNFETRNAQQTYQSLHGRQHFGWGINERASVKYLLLGATLFITAPAVAQVGLPNQPGTAGTTITREPNTTGNDRDVVVSRGATGADTATSDSAAGGNANRPEQAVPNGSAGGGSGGSN